MQDFRAEQGQVLRGEKTKEVSLWWSRNTYKLVKKKKVKDNTLQFSKRDQILSCKYSQCKRRRRSIPLGMVTVFEFVFMKVGGSSRRVVYPAYLGRNGHLKDTKNDVS